MGAPTAPPTELDLQIARDGVAGQAKSFGLDITDPAVAGFIEHQAQVVAADRAMQRFLQNILHAPVFDNAHKEILKLGVDIRGEQ